MTGSRTNLGFPHLSELAKLSILATVYYAVGSLSLSLGLVSPEEILIWPPIGVGLAALLLYGLRLWPGIVLGAFLLAMRTGVPVALALASALAISGETLLAAYLLQRWAGFRSSLDRVRDVFALLGLAGIISPLLGSPLGAASYCLAGLFPWSEIMRIWLLWWRSEAISVLVIAPAVLTWGSNPRIKWEKWKGIEALVLVSWLLLGNLLAFGRWPSIPGLYLLAVYLPFPVRIWAALRFGPRGATAANLLVVLIAAGGTLRGLGPLAGSSALQSLTALAAYAITSSGIVLLLAVGLQERQQVEKALSISEDRYRDLVEHSEDLICTHDLEGRILSVNEAPAKILGYESRELLQKSIRDVLAPEVREQFDEYLATFKRVNVASGMMLVLTKAGERRIWEYRNTLRTDGVVTPIVRGMAHDITERKRAEKALRESEEKFSKAFRSSPFAMVITTLQEGRFLEVNSTFERQFSCRRDELVGKTALELGIWLEPADRAKMISELLERGSLRNVEVAIRARGGELLLMRFSAEIIELGREKCVLALGEDITERRRLEEELRQAQKLEALGRLAGGVAHDFNNLLVGILGYSSKLAEELHPDDPRLKMAKIILDSAFRARELIRQLLVFSRKQMLNPTVIDLNRVVDELTDMLKPLIGEDIQLITALHAELGRVRVDRGQIEQVICNLVANARDAMPKGGKLTIETLNVQLDASNASWHPDLTPGPYIMLAVSDTGVGMEEEIRARAVEPFFTRKKPGKGTGLGLATVYGIITQSGGSISVNSEPGHGTSIQIYLPRVEAPLSEFAEETQSTEQVRQLRGSETVLLVEDEAVVRELARSVLADYGYTVLEARNPHDALHKVDEYNGAIHLLLTDVVMPGMSGRELAAHLARQRPQIKVLYMSGYPQGGTRHQEVLEASTPLVPKPFTPESLVQKVRNVLSS